MAERSFKHEVQSLRLGAGQVFRGEGILAVTKALLQAGVSYVGGYQGAPVSHLVDVLVDAQDLLAELGIQLETCANEAAAAALLGASITYPVRGAVTWKAIVGTNVAADALANLASPGVVGGALIIVGEDYGEGASVVQERSHAFALKSSLWLLDPRPDLPTIVALVQHGFALSEASNSPVMLELRVRACHMTGDFVAADNVAAAVSRNHPLAGPAAQDYLKLSHPPSIFAHEKLKLESRLPAARRYIREHRLNQVLPGDLADIGVVVQGGLTNALLRGLERFGLADGFGATRVPVLVLNVTHPLVPDELVEFCHGKRAVLMVEEGWPDYLEQELIATLARTGATARVFGKDLLPRAGEMNDAALVHGLAAFLGATAPAGLDLAPVRARAEWVAARKRAAAELVPVLPPRSPGFCTGCPERPVFSALKLVQRELGPVHIAADIGCHSFGTLAPFGMGNTILGYGMSLASAAAVGPVLPGRAISIMGDGGFWHNGVLTGVAGTVFNQGDGVLVIMQNGYTSATGQQFMPSSKVGRGARPLSIERALRAMGVARVRTVGGYRVGAMMAALRQALTTAERGLKVIIADGECQLARQRRVKAEEATRLAAGQIVVRVRYGIDDAVCTGDHSCIRLSGCPSLTIKPNPDPLRTDPVAAVIPSCVGCGLCGEVAEAAALCPSFWRAEIIHNPSGWQRWLARLRRRAIAWLSGPAELDGAAP